MRWNTYATRWSQDNFYGSAKEEDIPVVTCELWFEFRLMVDLANRDKSKLEGLLENIKCLKEDFI